MSIEGLDEGLLDSGSVSTGIKELDETYISGIPRGSVIAVVANPVTMAQQIAYALTRTDRKTHYVSTLQRASIVDSQLNDFLGVEELPERIETYDTVTGRQGENKSQKISKITGRLGESDNETENLVIDSFSNYVTYSDKQEYLKMVREIHERTQNTNALTYLFFGVGTLSDLERREKEAINLCDGVFRIDYDILGDDLQTYIDIIKLRGSEISDERVTLLVGDQLTVDTTRDIA